MFYLRNESRPKILEQMITKQGRKGLADKGLGGKRKKNEEKGMDSTVVYNLVILKEWE